MRTEEQSSSFFHTTYYRFVKTVLYLNVMSNFYIYSLTVSSFREFVWDRLRVLASVFVKEKTSVARQVEMECMWTCKLSDLTYESYLQVLLTSLTYMTYLQVLLTRLTYESYLQVLLPSLTYMTYLQDLLT